MLPDAEPVLVDLDGQHIGEHLAVLASPDSARYVHGVLGDAIEATRVLWLDRGNLRVLRQLDLDAPYVFEDRLLRPWRLPDGRLGLVTMQARYWPRHPPSPEGSGSSFGVRRSANATDGCHRS